MLPFLHGNPVHDAFFLRGAMLFAVMAAAACAMAQQKIIPAKSQIRFVTKQMNVPVEGQFKKFDGTVAFDPAKPEATKAEFEVDLGSIDLGNAEGETEARRKAWLNVEAFPKAQVHRRVGESAGRGQVRGARPAHHQGRERRRSSRPSRMTEAGGVRTVEGQFTLKTPAVPDRRRRLGRHRDGGRRGPRALQLHPTHQVTGAVHETHRIRAGHRRARRRIPRLPPRCRAYTIDPQHTSPTYEVHAPRLSRCSAAASTRPSGKIILDTAAKKGSARRDHRRGLHRQRRAASSTST